MKSAIMTGLFVLSTLANSAFSKDVFFPKDASHFVKIDLKESKTGPVISFSGCKALEGNTQALCGDIGTISVSEYKSMQSCLETKASIAHKVIVVSALGSVGGSGGSFVALAAEGPLAIPFVVGTLLSGALVIKGGIDETTALYKRAIYSQNNVSDKDCIHDKESFSRGSPFEVYTAYLKESFKSSLINCDASEGSQILTTKPYKIDLTAKQIKMLNKARDYGSVAYQED